MKGFGEINNSKKKKNEKSTFSKEQKIIQAIKFHGQGNILEATKSYKELISQGCKDQRVFSNYGAILQGLGKLQEAELSYRKAIELNPDYAIAHSNLGVILRDLGKFKEAELSYRKAIELNPDYAKAHLNLGVILRDLGKSKEAELSYRKAIELNPDSAKAHLNHGLILQDLGKLQDAELSYRKAIELKHDYAEAYLNLGNILRNLRKLDDAELSYRKVVELNPNYAIAHSNLGVILKDLGKLQDAELSYRKAIELNPNYAIAHSNLGVIFANLGKLQDAELSYRKAIELNPNYADAHLNLGNILRKLGKLHYAEISTLKAIELNPNCADAYLNLGNIFRNLGKLQDAEIFYRKAIKIDPDCAKAYFSLSLIKYSDEDSLWQNQLFSKAILNNKSKTEQIDICFARANILHKDKKYEESCRYLKMANKLKLIIQPSNVESLIAKSKELLIESNKKVINKKEKRNSHESIFIVGMPRSGSTLLESILSMSNDVYDLGETNILEEAFLECKNSEQNINLSELYLKKVYEKTNLNITTNKNLYNYRYAGIICNQIPKAKIIHCFRHPLDNILSIYRENFYGGNQYSSSLIDCAKVYLNHEELMTAYKKRFRSKIYNLNYDSLVFKPNQEIRSLISWLGWKWDNKYQSPHLNPRSVSTASAVQVRSPINSKSVGGWMNYKSMLKPAIEILTQNERYEDINS